MILVVLVVMALKKDIVLPCIVGLFIMGAASTGSVVKGVQVIYNSLIAAGTEFWGIIVIISLIVAMSKALKDIGADNLMMAPIKKIMVNNTTAFWGLGCTMMIISWFIWPSPAIALVGAIMMPSAIKAGLPALWAAVAMNLFGHGIALSSDFFVQGAPAITAKAAGFESSMGIINASIPLWTVMSIVTAVTAYIMMKKDLKKHSGACAANEEVQCNVTEEKKAKPSLGAYVVAVITPFVFLFDMLLMFKYKLVGGEATALVGGTAVIIMAVAAVIEHKISDSLEKVTEYVKEGFLFGIKVFAPVIVIGAFFFLGGESTAKQILGENATGFLTDIGLFLSQNVPMAKLPIIVVQGLIGGITGLDGSGFSGLPLVGALSHTFSTAAGISIEGLGAVGQLAAVWVGGGTIIPWSVVPVAAICNVSPIELAKKNLIPVLTGFEAMTVTAFIIL